MLVVTSWLVVTHTGNTILVAAKRQVSWHVTTAGGSFEHPGRRLDLHGQRLPGALRTAKRGTQHSHGCHGALVKAMGFCIGKMGETVKTYGWWWWNRVKHGDFWRMVIVNWNLCLNRKHWLTNTMFNLCFSMFYFEIWFKWMLSDEINGKKWWWNCGSECLNLWLIG